MKMEPAWPAETQEASSLKTLVGLLLGILCSAVAVRAKALESALGCRGWQVLTWVAWTWKMAPAWVTSMRGESSSKTLVRVAQIREDSSLTTLEYLTGMVCPVAAFRVKALESALGYRRRQAWAVM
eukprot:jgi/Undpi1/9698/HiC_scaffold_27.g12154.m1